MLFRHRALIGKAGTSAVGDDASDMLWLYRRLQAVVLLGIMAALLMACTAGTPEPTPTPIGIKLAFVAPQLAAAPNAVVIQPPAPGTPPLAQLLKATAPAQPIATPTPVNTVTPTPFTTPPTPYAEVISTWVHLRSGPSTDYEVVQIWAPQLKLRITGRSLDGQWLQVCCLQMGSDQEVKLWVINSENLISIHNPDSIQVYATPIIPPTLTPTQTPLPTQTPFARSIGPEYFPTSHQSLTIWVKVYVGPPENEEPLAGYLLAVQFQPTGQTMYEKRNNEWRNSNGDATSVNRFDYSAPEGAGNRVRYNYRYDYGTAGKGTWVIWLTDAEGRQLSAKETFTTDPDNPNREIYIGWVRVA